MIRASSRSSLDLGASITTLLTVKVSNCDSHQVLQLSDAPLVALKPSLYLMAARVPASRAFGAAVRTAGRQQVASRAFTTCVVRRKETASQDPDLPNMRVHLISS